MKIKLAFIAILFLLSSFSVSAQVVRTVTSPFDTGKGTLRDIIGLCTSGDTVRFNITGTITLTAGSIDFNSGIYIDGPNKDSLKVSGAGNYTVFKITGGSVTIKGISILDAEDYGIYYNASSDSLTIIDCEISKCYNESSSGTALYVGTSKQIIIKNTLFDGNRMYGDGRSRVYGGACYLRSSGNIIIDGCTFSKNTAQSVNWGGTGSDAEAYGGAVYASSPYLNLSNSTFTSNSATGGGCCGYRPNWSIGQGGALFFSGSKIRIDDCHFQSNRVGASDFRSYNLQQGSAIFLNRVDSAIIENSELRSNSCGGGNYVNLYGGCIFAYLNTFMKVSNSTLASNSGKEIGAICVDATSDGKGRLVLEGTKIDSNSSSSGTYPSAVLCRDIASLSIEKSRIKGNAQAGIYTNNVGTVEVEQSLFDSNTYHMYLNNPTGANNLVLNSTFRNGRNKAILYKNTSSNYVTNNTFNNNNGDIYLDKGAAIFTNNIFTYDKFITNSFGRSGTEVPLSGGGNIVKGSSFKTYFTNSNDINTRDPQLDKFGNHGGPTMSYSLQSKSPAIDLGGNDSILEDQRGFLRDTLTDAGAFEHGALDPFKIVIDTVTGASQFCIGDTAMLEIKSSGKVISYQWFKDGILMNGQVNKTLQIDSLTLKDSANYHCVLMNSVYTDSSAKVLLEVNPFPEVIAHGSDTICIGDSTEIYSIGASTYIWSDSLGDSSHIVILPIATTTYQVTGTLKGCSSSAQVTVWVDSLPNVEASGSDTICIGESATISASGADSYSWSESAGTTAQVMVSPTQSTTYTVMGLRRECSSIDSVRIWVDSLPEVKASNDTTICIGDTVTISAQGAVSFSWDQGAGIGSSVQVHPKQKTTYNVVGKRRECTSTDSVTISLTSLPNVEAHGDTSICKGDTAFLSASGADSYTWSNGAGDSSHVQVSPVASTTFIVTGTRDGCQAMSSAEVTLKPTPDVKAIATDSFTCDSASVILSGTGASSYEWDNDLGAGSSVHAMFKETTTFTVIGTKDGCSNKGQVTVYVFDSPDPPIIESGDHLETGIYQSYQWLKDGKPIVGATERTYTPIRNGDYQVEVKEENGCSGLSSTIITVTKFVGIQDIHSEGISVYPNPNNGLIRLKLGDITVAEVTIIEANGQVLKSFEQVRSNDILDLGPMAIGWMVLKVESEQHVSFHRIYRFSED